MISDDRLSQVILQKRKAGFVEEYLRLRASAMTGQMDAKVELAHAELAWSTIQALRNPE